jgi:hypothetical protein
MSFLELADVLHVGHEFVRSRLTRTPANLFWTGKAYQVPLPIAIELVKATLTTARVIKAKANPLLTAKHLSIDIDWRNHPHVQIYKFDLDELQAKNEELKRLLRSVKIVRVTPAKHTKTAGGPHTLASGL